MVAAVMLSVALPVLDSVTVCVALLPTFMLLNATEDGLTFSCACAAVPTPLRPITSGEPGAVLVIETLPLALPEAVGAKLTVNVAVPPGVSVCGERVLMLKGAPLALAALIDRFAVPEFVSVTFNEALFPTKMLAKFRLGGFAVSAA
jgi:hypothetical protein